MTDLELLAALEADQKILFNRFCGNQALAMKFIRKFAEDPNFGDMRAAYAAGDYAGVEMTSHTLKGIAANLELKRLSALASRVCGAVRAQEYSELPAHMREIEKEYQRIVDLIREA